MSNLRTWEALSLGTIPIVKRSGPFDEVYMDLPVLLVDSWEDVNVELLSKTLEDWKEKSFGQLRKLSWRAWV